MQFVRGKFGEMTTFTIDPNREMDMFVSVSFPSENLSVSPKFPSRNYRDISILFALNLVVGCTFA